MLQKDRDAHGTVLDGMEGEQPAAARIDHGRGQGLSLTAVLSVHPKFVKETVQTV